jgi:predicted esterase
MYLAMVSSKPQRSCGDPRVQHKMYELSATKEPLPYALFVPTSYAHGTAAPLMVLLHGFGAQYDSMLSEKFAGLLDAAERLGMILVTPIGYHRAGWYGSRKNQLMPVRFLTGRDLRLETDLSERDVIEVLTLVRKSHSVDPERIYLCGHSMGGMGALHLGMKYPKLWAAIAVFAPAVYPETGLVRKMNDLRMVECPVFVSVGTNDRFPLVEPVRAWAAHMAEIGLEHEFVEVQDGDHENIMRSQLESMLSFLTRHRNRCGSALATASADSAAEAALAPVVIHLTGIGGGILIRLFRQLKSTGKSVLRGEMCTIC